MDSRELVQRVPKRVTMRFRKGNKVEVWNRREVPSGSWWSAEVISGNGHSYSVRYDGYPTNSRVAVDRVPREVIRPCPPPQDDLKDLMSGDLIEVFDNNSWKFAEVLTIIDKYNCSVKLLGSSRELIANKSHIRRQLSWQDNKWMVIQKVSGKENGETRYPLKRGKFSCHMPESCEVMQNSSGKNNFPRDLSRGMNKRTLYKSIPFRMCIDGRSKMRAMENDGRHRKTITEHPVYYLGKVGRIASTKRLPDQKYTYRSFNNDLDGSSMMELGRGMSSSKKRRCLGRSSGPNGDESTSTSSSVDSCSVSSSPCTPQQQHVTYPSLDHGEISCSFKRDLAISKKELLAVHQLELNAYRSTLLAFRASGPVSWEREAVMTNLRLMLNISNDEHLMEIRNLINSEMATMPS